MLKLKYEDTAHIGDIIKAMDFESCPNREDSFIIGGVINISMINGAKVFEVNCYEDWCGNKKETRRVGKTVYVPMELAFMEFENRVSKLH